MSLCAGCAATSRTRSGRHLAARVPRAALRSSRALFALMIGRSRRDGASFTEAATKVAKRPNLAARPRSCFSLPAKIFDFLRFVGRFACTTHQRIDPFTRCFAPARVDPPLLWLYCLPLLAHRLAKLPIAPRHPSIMSPFRIVPRWSSAMLAAALLVTLGLAGPAFALEYPIGKPQIRAGIEVTAVYLQPISMEPVGMMRSVRDSDIHLEEDIKAQSDNPNGFPDGTFVPYLDVHYEIAKVGSGETIRGELMPMVANDGPHYGENVKLQGAGKYHVRITVAPPGPGSHFGRHTDKE